MMIVLQGIIWMSILSITAYYLSIEMTWQIYVLVYLAWILDDLLDLARERIDS